MAATESTSSPDTIKGSSLTSEDFEMSENVLGRFFQRNSSELQEPTPYVEEFDDSLSKIKEENMSNEDNRNYSLDSGYTMLIIPKRKRIRVLNELTALGINTADFGVNKTVEFLSGAVLFEFDTTDGKKEMKKIVEQSETFSEKESKKTYFPDVRIHSVPFIVTNEEILNNIINQFGEYPVKINFLLYNSEYFGQYFIRTVLLHVTDTLLDKIEMFPYIYIRGIPFQIDTTVHVPRCFNCKLLGHTSKKCDLPNRPYPTNFEVICIDCRSYNQQVIDIKIFTRRLRNENHPTGHERCNTKRHYEYARLKNRIQYYNSMKSTGADNLEYKGLQTMNY